MSVMAGNSTEQLHRLLERYTLFDSVPDIDRYRRILVPKAGSCMFRGCTEPIAWEDARGGNFLCEGHYLTVRKWIGEARAGLVR
jgi:hypothetical protein